MKAGLALLALLAGCAAAEVPPPTVAPPVALSGTVVHDLPATGTGRRYQLWVDLPRSYASSSRHYPAVFVTDADWSFAMVRGIRNLVGRDGRNIEEFILVGMTHEQDLPDGHSRSRDYTPTNPLRDPDRNAEDYSYPAYGEAETYRRYVEAQVFPLVASQYRADMSRKVYLGHSYGGLFGAYVLLTRPDMFGTYVLGSPSLWFDRKVAFRLERAHAARAKNLPARVMMITGSHERPGTGPRNNKTNDLVGDSLAFAATLRARNYPNLSVEAEIVPDEDHLTVFTDVAARGLLWALPGKGPRDGG